MITLSHQKYIRTNECEKLNTNIVLSVVSNRNFRYRKIFCKNIQFCAQKCGFEKSRREGWSWKLLLHRGYCLEQCWHRIETTLLELSWFWITFSSPRKNPCKIIEFCAQNSDFDKVIGGSSHQWIFHFKKYTQSPTDTDWKMPYLPHSNFGRFFRRAKLIAKFLNFALEILRFWDLEWSGGQNRYSVLLKHI